MIHFIFKNETLRSESVNEIPNSLKKKFRSLENNFKKIYKDYWYIKFNETCFKTKEKNISD